MKIRMIEVIKTNEGIHFNVRVLPRSSRNQIVGEEACSLKIKPNAPPAEGEADKALISFLAEVLDLAKSNIVIVRGETLPISW